MKTNLYNQQGKKTTSSVELADSVFAGKVNDKLLSQYVYIYLGNQRESNAHTKDRSEVSGGGRKPWKQKGTGRARQGSIRAPHFVKGGVAWGPRNEREHTRTLNRKAKQAALRSAFSKAVAENRIFILDELKAAGMKTSDAQDVADGFKAEKILLVLPSVNKDALQAFNNLYFAKVRTISELNAYDLLIGGTVVMDQACLDFINTHWVKGEKNVD